jgi:predicted ATPase
MGMDHSQARFGELTVKGFRRLLDVRLALRPLSVMIGANGTGKTSVLDVLALLAASAQGKLASSISELSGLANVLTYDRAEELGLEIGNEDASDDPLDYSLRLRPQGLGYEISEETLSLRQLSREGLSFVKAAGRDISYLDADEAEMLRPTWEHNPLETSLAQVPKMFQEPEDFRRRLASSTFYHVLNVDPRSPVRLPQSVAPVELPGRNGEDLVSCLYYLRETNRDRFEVIEDSLRVAFPRFDRLDFPPVAAGTLALAWRERGSSKPLYAHQLSEGTLRFLWLTTLLQSPGLTALTLLDEPEVSLHPELLSLLADQLREASRRTQIVVATHSDTLIRFLDPAEVVVMDSTEDGMTTLKRADELDLGEWLKDYSLDELWRNGRIGARA